MTFTRWGMSFAPLREYHLIRISRWGETDFSFISRSGYVIKVIREHVARKTIGELCECEEDEIGQDKFNATRTRLVPRCPALEVRLRSRAMGRTSRASRKNVRAHRRDDQDDQHTRMLGNRNRLLALSLAIIYILHLGFGWLWTSVSTAIPAPGICSAAKGSTCAITYWSL